MSMELASKPGLRSTTMPTPSTSAVVVLGIPSADWGGVGIVVDGNPGFIEPAFSAGALDGVDLHLVLVPSADVDPSVQVLQRDRAVLRQRILLVELLGHFLHPNKPKPGLLGTSV